VADQGYHLVLLDLEADALEHQALLLGGIGKVDVPEFHLSDAGVCRDGAASS